MTPDPQHSISPIIGFDDFDAGLELMTKVFGFEEHTVMRADTGEIVHCELRWGSTIVMPAPRKPDSEWAPGPTSWYLTVDDPDKHYARSEAAGLEVIRPLTDQPYGSREYGVRDPSGNVWVFGTYRPGA